MEVKAPGKLMLSGEYAVLDGSPAVLAGVNRFVRVSMHPGTLGEPFRVECLLGSETAGPTPLVEACFEVLREEPGLELPTWGVLRIDSSELSRAWSAKESGSKLGLGSSAATAVALLRALGGGRRGPGRLMELADQAHRRSQGGLGSGADIAAAVHGGLVQFWQRQVNGERSFEVHPLDKRSRGGCIGLACWMGQSASTPELVRRVQQWKQTATDRHRERMSEIGAASARVVEALQGRDPEALVGAVHAGFEAMVRLDEQSRAGLVLESHHRLARLAETHGGAAKPTGAGGGDLGLAVFPPGADVEALRTELSTAGLPPVNLEIASEPTENGPSDPAESGFLRL